MHAIVGSVVRSERAHRTWPRDVPFRKRELTLEVAGLVTHEDGSQEFVGWGRVPLKSGDTISLRVAELSRVDEPIRRERSEAESIEEVERRELERLDRKYRSGKKARSTERNKRPRRR